MANDISGLKIDQRASFTGMVLLGSQPKTVFGSAAQDTTKDGKLKWSVEVLAAVRNDFTGGTDNRVFTIGMTTKSGDPAEGIPAFTPIELGGFEVGVMEKTRRTSDGGKEITGVSVWFRAQEIKLAAQSAKAA